MANRPKVIIRQTESRRKQKDLPANMSSGRLENDACALRGDVVVATAALTVPLAFSKRYHADHVLGAFKTHRETIDWAKKQAHAPLTASPY